VCEHHHAAGSPYLFSSQGSTGPNPFHGPHHTDEAVSAARPNATQRVQPGRQDQSSRPELIWPHLPSNHGGSHAVQSHLGRAAPPVPCPWSRRFLPHLRLEPRPTNQSRDDHKPHQHALASRGPAPPRGQVASKIHQHFRQLGHRCSPIGRAIDAPPDSRFNA